MHLIPNAGRVLRRAWSVRLFALSIAAQVAEVVLPYFQDFIPPSLFSALSIGAAIGGIISRILPQRNITDADQ